MSCPRSGFLLQRLLLSKIAEEADSQEYIDAVERMEPEVEDLASRIVDNLNIVLSPPEDEA